ncbi:GSKIP domain-containing protein [Desulfothermus sp.]
MERIPLAELIESELSAAIFGSDKQAIKRISILLSEKIEKIEEVELEQEETKSDLKVLIELVKQGFEDVNRRFEDVNRRFEDVNSRFEDINRRFDMMFKFMSIGFTVITILIVVFKFIH